MRMNVRVSDSRIQEVAYRTYGCVPAIAAGSYVTEWARGRSVAEVLAYTADELCAALGGLPPDRLFCADLAVTAIQAAVQDALKAGGPR